MRILFTYLEQFKILFSLIRPKPIISELFIPTFSSRSPNLTGASFKSPLISSWSLHSHVSKSPQVSSFISQILPGELCFFYFHFQFLQWFVQDFSSLVIISIHSLFPNPPVVRWRPSQVCVISLLILSTRISSMPKIRCLSSI